MERRAGSRALALAYVGTGVCAAAASVRFCRLPAAGASGALFGLLGFEGTAAAWASRDASDSARAAYHDGHATAIFRVTAVSLALGALIPGLDNSGHIGGCLGGVACGFAERASRLPVVTARRRRASPAS